MKTLSGHRALKCETRWNDANNRVPYIYFKREAPGEAPGGAPGEASGSLPPSTVSGVFSALFMLE